VADALKLPYADNSVDLVTARMVYHHLEDIPAALNEALRIVKPGGKVMIIEYVLPHDFALPFERKVFDIKEKGRHLWTGPELANTLYKAAQESLDLTEADPVSISLNYDLLPQYSVKDWLTKSGLSAVEQASIFQLYAHADQRSIRTMNMTQVKDEQTGQVEDVLVDRPFAYVVITKPKAYDQAAAAAD
jgi:ubiquinone/menaquinone biosynthesis C-methylase UbiE